MKKIEYRIQAMKLLYLLEMGGEYDEETIDPTVFNAVSDLITHTDEIEKIINDAMTGWSLKHINKVDQAILKFAVYEMKYQKIPYQIAINEALEVTKEYSDLDGKQVAFNNKVLDKAKDLILGK